MATERKPSEAAYTAAANPAGPAPTIVRSYPTRRELTPSRALRRQFPAWPVRAGSRSEGCIQVAEPGLLLDGQQRRDVPRTVDFDPLIGNTIAAEEVTDAVADSGRRGAQSKGPGSHRSAFVIDHRHGARPLFKHRSTTIATPARSPAQLFSHPRLALIGSLRRRAGRLQQWHR